LAASSDLPARCEVTGYVASSVGIKLDLPVAWNGKFMEVGCGGHCGVLDGNSLPWSCDTALRRGYACVVSDMGHRSAGGADGLWAYGNLQAKLDWGIRAGHVAAVAGKALAEWYYAQKPSKAYFMGCSTGGRQALQEVQHFPWDFDGVLAGAPPVNLSTIYMTFVWGIRATHDAAGKALLDAEDLKRLTAAAVAQCDLDDGVKDGIIGDPLHCAFDPSVLACKSGHTQSCLTATQIKAVKEVYAGPMTSRGAKLSLGGPLPGSEYLQLAGLPHDWRAAYTGVDGHPAAYEALATDGFRYLFLLPEPGPTWKLSDFDFDRDYQRLGLMQSLYDSSNPDLRKFKAAGGKLIVFQGLSDISVLPRSTIDYYEAVERVMGSQAATQDFARLFLLPGVGHCSGGDGAFDADYLSALEAWVETDRAPDKLLTSHIRLGDLRIESSADFPKLIRRLDYPLDPSTIEFSRPVYPYPLRAKYRGQGDPRDAASFVAADR
jgi:feruloyl esterase